MLRRLARWHVWLGWLVGVPLLMWTLTGLFMVSRPIDEVRGTHLRTEVEEPGLQLARIGNVTVEPGTVKSATLVTDGGTPVWQFTYVDDVVARFTFEGTHVYVGRDTGVIGAVRTRWWRVFDVMWGLHIMDLQERETTSHPILIAFTALSAFCVMLGCILMFRRRNGRIGPARVKGGVDHG